MSNLQTPSGAATTAAGNNPANAPEKALPQRTRIPMSLPTQKLAVPEIPGFHCHWMRGEPQRINQALRAGYDWVHPDEVDMNDFGIANGPNDSGNQDLGSRVSHVSGRDEKGGVQMLYLMKLPEHLWLEDQAVLARQQDNIAAQLRGDKGLVQPGADAELDKRYSRGEQRTMLHPKRRM